MITHRVVTTVAQFGVVRSPKLTAYTAGAKRWEFAVFGETGEPIDLSDQTVIFRVDRQNGDDLFNITGVVSGDNNNLVTITTTSTHNATPGVYRYSLRDETGNVEVLAQAQYVIDVAAS